MTEMLTKDQMLEQYNVLGFGYGICVVERKSDGIQGTLDFSDRPVIHPNNSSKPFGMARYYYNFVEVS